MKKSSKRHVIKSKVRRTPKKVAVVKKSTPKKSTVAKKPATRKTSTISSTMMSPFSTPKKSTTPAPAATVAKKPATRKTSTISSTMMSPFSTPKKSTTPAPAATVVKKPTTMSEKTLMTPQHVLIKKNNKPEMYTNSYMLRMFSVPRDSLQHLSDTPYSYSDVDANADTRLN